MVISVPKEKVWNILLDKIFHPDKYIPGIEEFEIKERDTNEYIRYLYTETDDVIELIIVDEEQFMITSTLVKHSFLKGKLIQTIKEQDNKVLLVFEQDRQITIPEFEGIDMQLALDAALEQIHTILTE